MQIAVDRFGQSRILKKTIGEGGVEHRTVAIQVVGVGQLRHRRQARPARLARQDGAGAEARRQQIGLLLHLAGQGGVNGSLNIGQFSANQLTADLDKRIVRLQGNARLRINQGVLK